MCIRDSILGLADGIILTGGEDINPLEYNDIANIELCGPIDYSRDTLERKLFDFAFSNKIPLIGVCRGMQMMNVVSGGTLYVDIPSELGTKVIHRNYGEVMHEIVLTCNNIDYTNLIFPLVQDTFLVNSWHHQGVKDVAHNIKVIAKSYDGLPDNLKAAVDKAYADAGKYSFEVMNKAADESIVRMKATGVTMVDIDRAPFVSIMADWYKAKDAAGELPAGFLATVAATR